MTRLILSLFSLIVLNGCVTANVTTNSKFDKSKTHKVSILEVPRKDKEKFWTVLIAGAGLQHNSDRISEYLQSELHETGKYTITAANKYMKQCQFML